jgi:hypothetical protein
VLDPGLTHSGERTEPALDLAQDQSAGLALAAFITWTHAAAL